MWENKVCRCLNLARTAYPYKSLRRLRTVDEVSKKGREYVYESKTGNLPRYFLTYRSALQSRDAFLPMSFVFFTTFQGQARGKSLDRSALWRPAAIATKWENIDKDLLFVNHPLPAHHCYNAIS